MPYIKQPDLYTQLRAKKFFPVYLFAGEETQLQEEAWLALEKALNVNPLNREIFFGGDSSIDDILLAAQTLPMMGDLRLIVVKDVQKIKSSEAEKLASFLNMPVPSTCLLLLWQDKIRRDDKSAPLFSVIEQGGAVVEFRQLYERELPAWINQKVKLYGKKITPEAAQYLISEAGTNLLDIQNEIEKLSLFCGSADITLKDVEASSGHTRQVNLNQLAEAVEAKKIDASFALLENLLAEGEIPLKILATIQRVMRRLLTAKSLMEEDGLSAEDIRQQMRLHPYFDRSFFTHLGRYSLAGLKNSLEKLLAADCAFKTSARPEHYLFEELLIALSKC